MQRDSPRRAVAVADDTSNSTTEIIPEDWIIDLQRIVQNHIDVCPHDPEAEFIVSVYTWLVDHNTQRLCRTPKIAVLGGDPSEWYDDIIHPWRYHVQVDEPIFLDVVQPNVRRSDIEEHIAHIIITQHASVDRSVMLSMLFKGDTPPDVIIRFAVALPKLCTVHDVVNSVPLYALHSLNRITWEHPILQQDDQAFQTRPGMGIQVTVWPATDLDSEQREDGVSLFQHFSGVGITTSTTVNTNIDSLTGHCLKGTEIQDDIDVPMMSNRPTNRIERRPRPLHDGSEQWFWELGSIFSTQATQEVIDGDSYIYVQTWFIDHVRHVNCRVPRSLRLDQNWITWIEECRYLWRDLLDPNTPFSIHVVKPRPPQSRWQDFNCHILLEQNRPIGRAAGIITVLQSSTSTTSASQGAYVMHRHIRKQDVIDTMELNPICDDHHCAIYYGREPIHIVVATEVSSGFSIRVQITSRNDQRPSVAREETLEFDSVSMMQQPPPEQAIDLPPNATECTNFDLDFQLNAAAQPFQPGRFANAEHGEFIQDLISSWATVAYVWDPDSPSATCMTWFVDHRRLYPNCVHGRPVTLTNDFDAWEEKLKEAWQEVIDPFATHEMYLVMPQPPNMEPGLIGHVIIIQSPVEQWVSSLVTVFDSFISRREQHMRRLVITTDEHIRIEQVVNHCGYELIEGRLDPVLHCQAWIDQHELVEGNRWPGRSGHEITVQINRQITRLAEYEPEHTSLLQLSQTDFPVLILEELLHDPLPSSDLIPYGLLHIDFMPQLPDTVLISDGCTEQEVESELHSMGHHRHVYQLGQTGKFATIPINWNPEGQMYHYIFHPTNDTKEGEILLHSSHSQLNELEHMRCLHAHGFMRAVIVQVKRVRWNLSIIQYHNNTPELEIKQITPARQTEWPDPQPLIMPDKMIDFHNLCKDRPDSCLHLGLDLTQIQDFCSSDDAICPWHSHLDLQGFVKDGIDQIVSQEGKNFDPASFDRLVIYTDGSSKAHNRRKAPLCVAEKDIPDAWSYVVLGERYPKAGQRGSLTFLGWHAQQVMYEQDNNAFTGTNQIGAEYAEREALIFAGLWRLALNSTIPTVFRTDSSTSADQATGRAGFNTPHATIYMLRGIYQALEAGMPKDCLHVEHVKGHAGDSWNELADYLAKSEAMAGHHLKRQQIDLKVLGPALPYFWMFLTVTDGLPQFTQHGFNICPPNLPTRNVDTSITSQTAETFPDRDFQLNLASLNVGSLYLSPDGFSGKLSFLRQQMQSHAIHILGIQEARSSPGLSVVDGVLRIAGGSQNGHLGVELWVSLTQPITTSRRQKICIKRSDVQLLHHDARRLLVRFACNNLDCFVAVLHGPQSGRPLQERRHWWEETGTILQDHCKEFPTYILIDANAKTGPTQPPIVFEKDDQTSSNTPFFLEFLDMFGQCLPCTSSVQQGPQHTWTTPDGLTEHRIDYVAIPQELLPRCSWSGVVPTLDTGHVHSDHIATAVQLTWSDTIQAFKRKPDRLAHDRTKIQSHWNKIDFNNFIAENWKCDIETQVQNMNKSFHSVLHEACPLSKTLPKKSFIDDQTWQLRATKLRLRKRLQQTKKQSRFDLLSKIFNIWTGRTQDLQLIANHETTVLCGTLSLSCEYWRCSKKLKQRLQMMKTNALQTAITNTGAQASAGTLLHVLKPFIGSTNLKKQKQASLPIVRKNDGTICATPSEALNRWVEFFQAMEGGQRMTHQEARQRWIDNLQGFLEETDIQLPVQEMPTLCELEVAFRRVSIGKAIGIDEVPPELCHFCPVQLAKICYPLLLKAALFGQEAHEHKGGKLAIAWKKRGDVRDCHTHRSLLVSSHIGKTIHRALRQKSHHLYDAYMQRQQLGGKAHMPVSIPLHMTRAFLRWKQRENRPTAVIFLDLTEAFYRTLRPLAVGGVCSDHCISLMCQKLGLESDAYQDLCRLLQEPSALAAAQAPRHVQKMLQAVHCDTWFKLGQQHDLVRTEIGSRPGDSFADIVFGLLWAKLLQKLEKSLTAQGILEQIPDVEFPDPYQSHIQEEFSMIPLLGPTWMDDLSVLVTATTNAELIRKTQVAISQLIDSCLDFQMEPNFRKEKLRLCSPSRDHNRATFVGSIIAEKLACPLSVNDKPLKFRLSRDTSTLED